MSAVLLVKAVLLAASPVAAIVGTRVYPVQVPQGQSLPAIVLTAASHEDERTLQGHGGYPLSEVIVDSCGATYEAADALAAAIRTALEDYRSGPIEHIASTPLEIDDRGDSGDHFRRRNSYLVRWRTT